MVIDLEWIQNNTNLVIYFIKTTILSIATFYTSVKLLNIKEYWSIKYKIIFTIGSIGISAFSRIINKVTTIDISTIMYIIILSSTLFKFATKCNFGYSICVIAIALSINQISFILASVLEFFIYMICKIRSEYINFIVIILIYLFIIFFILKIKRIKNGVSILKKNKDNNYFNLLILNISVIVLFSSVILSSYTGIINRRLGMSLIIIAIMMFVTIQKSLELYYKQRMLVKDLEETKKELEEKKSEVKELEKENLNFSKISHTIAHRQKSLEHKLEELNMNNEISNEIGARIEDVTKDLRKETPVELSKTGIEVIDDMLSYMQSECIKNKIDFQLQLNGNIYTMTNHYIGKDELEILLADHIKDAIIAIGYADTVNKSILVRLGKINGIYSLYIYDSGIEFEIDTFKELGIKPSTTHKDNGGTGMGFMNTFDTLRKYKASLEIKEIGKPCKDNFTKVLKFKFDNKEEFTIKSYRKDEIKKKDKENKLNLI